MLIVEEVIFPALDLTLEVEAVLDDGMMKRSWREVEVKVGVVVKVEAGAGCCWSWLLLTDNVGCWWGLYTQSHSLRLWQIGFTMITTRSPPPDLT